MKVISLLEPWASLMQLSAKRNETRSWSTDYRGDVAIASSKNMYPEDKRMIRMPEHPEQRRWRTAVFKALGVSQPEECIELLGRTAGHILCVVNLRDVVATNSQRFVDSQEFLFGNYGPNRFVWITDHCRQLRDPLPWRGMQGLRDVLAGVEAEIRKRL